MTDLRTLLGDKEFMKHITEMENAEDVQKAFKEKGVDLTLGQIEEIGSIINATVEKGSALSEDELEDISGGDGFKSFVEGLKSPFEQVLDGGSGLKRAGAGTALGGVAVISMAIGASVLYGGQKAVKWFKNRKKK